MSATPKSTQSGRNIDPRRAYLGKFIRVRRTELPRLSPCRRDYPNMTKDELAMVLNEEHNRVPGAFAAKGASYIAKVEEGRIRITRTELRYFGRALRASRRQRAILEELAGYEGLFRLLAQRLGVPPKPSIWASLNGDPSQLTTAEIEELVEEWLQAAIDEIKRRLLSGNAEQ
jgi:hypothetical protein